MPGWQGRVGNGDRGWKGTGTAPKSSLGWKGTVTAPLPSSGLRGREPQQPPTAPMLEKDRDNLQIIPGLKGSGTATKRSPGLEKDLDTP